MSFKQDLYTFLSSNITKADIVSANRSIGDSEKYLTYQKLNNDRDYSHDGYNKMARATYLFEIYAKEKNQATAIADQLIDKLDDYIGVMGSTRIQGTFVIREFDDFDKDTNMYVEEIEIDIQYYD